MSLYLMWVYSITRSQLCWDWVLDYVSMRLLSLTQFIWRPSVLQLCCSGTHRINTRSNVTVPDVSVFHHKESLCWDWVLDYVSMRLLSLTQFIWRPSVLQLCCSGTHRINTRSNVTVPDVSVFHRKKSIVFQWVLDYVSMRLLSPHNSFGDHPSQFSSSGTHRINTRRNVTVPDVSVFHRKKSIVFQLGAWLCKHETALPHTIHLETIRPPVVLLCTHRINTSSNVTVPDVSVFHHKESIVLRLGAWLCKHETALPHTIHWRPSVLQLCCSGTHRINTRSNVTVPDVSVFHRKKSIVLRLGAWLCKHETALLYNSFGDHPSPSSPALALTESIQVVMSLYLMWVYSITRSQLCWDWVLDYVSMRLLSLTQFIWRPSVLQLCCSGTHRINTRSVHVMYYQCIDSVSARAAQLEDGWSPMNCVRESSLMLT